jgi:hypothetical protein
MNKNLSIEEELIIYNKKIKSLALTDLDHHQPKIPNSSENIICQCKDCESKYTQDEINIYLKLRNNEIDIIKQNTDSTIEYSRRVLFAFGINSANAILNIQKDPFNFKNGYRELYNLNPTNENEKEILKTLIKDYENKKFKPNKRVVSFITSYYPFEWLKKQFADKINNPLSDKKAVIEQEIKKWIIPIKEPNIKGSGKFYNEIYNDIRSSKTVKQQDNYFTFFYRILVIEEKIKYEMYLNSQFNDDFKNKTSRVDEDKPKQFQHPNIFKNNAFDVWQSMYDACKINESSRTDVRFTFEIMQKENMIHDTVRYVDFLKWVNSTHQIAVGKISYADLKNKNRLFAFEQAKTNYNK